MGNRRIPDHLKVLSGTARNCRMNPNAPKVAEGIASPPVWLSERASEIFLGISAILDQMGIGSPNDAAALALLASRIEEIEICTAIIEDSGRTYEKRDDAGGLLIIRARPEVGMRNEAMRHCQSLLVEFGLSPAARAKVSASGGKEENPFAALEFGF